MIINYLPKYKFNNSLMRQVYIKLRFLHQKDFYVYDDYVGNYAIHVVIPSLNREYKLIHRLKSLEVINTENSKVESYSDFDLKSFIKVMKKILRGKSINLRRLKCLDNSKDSSK